MLFAVCGLFVALLPVSSLFWEPVRRRSYEFGFPILKTEGKERQS